MFRGVCEADYSADRDGTLVEIDCTRRLTGGMTNRMYMVTLVFRYNEMISRHDNIFAALKLIEEN